MFIHEKDPKNYNTILDIISKTIIHITLCFCIYVYIFIINKQHHPSNHQNNNSHSPSSPASPNEEPLLSTEHNWYFLERNRNSDEDEVKFFNDELNKYIESTPINTVQIFNEEYKIKRISETLSELIISNEKGIEIDRVVMYRCANEWNLQDNACVYSWEPDNKEYWSVHYSANERINMLPCIDDKPATLEINVYGTDIPVTIVKLDHKNAYLIVYHQSNTIDSKYVMKTNTVVTLKRVPYTGMDWDDDDDYWEIVSPNDKEMSSNDGWAMIPE